MPQPADMVNVAFLTDSERELIMEVLRRDEELRRAEEQRVRRLKVELVDIKRKGAKRSSGRYSENSCGRCLQPLGRLSGTSQCKACKHPVCHNCRAERSKGSWVCSVCAKEADLKKCTGAWFYDQRVNRFSTTPGHDMVKTSLKKWAPSRKRETAGEVLLRSTELNPSQSTTPVPRPRLRDLPTSNKDLPDRVSEEPVHVKDQQQRSDTESAERTSLNSLRTDTESSLGTPVFPSKKSSGRSSPASSSMSSMNVPVKAESVHSSTSDGIHSSTSDGIHSSTSDGIHSSTSDGIHSSTSDGIQSAISGTTSSLSRRAPSPSTGFSSLEEDGLFKRSVRRSPKPSEFTSVLDLRGEVALTPDTCMGDRSKSVPGLNVPDDEEEDEDIDNLVSIHRKEVCSSMSNLRGSKSTLGSMMSIYSEAGDYDSVAVSGDVLFSVRYEDTVQSLDVLIKECHSLAHGDATRQRSNPYVKCYLLPDKSRMGKKKTSVKRNTVNPTYNETLKFSVSRSQVLTRCLQISVWHHDRLGRNAFLGEVEVPLGIRDLDAGQEECMVLVGKAHPMQSSAFSQYKGELVISLKYVSAKKPPVEKTKGRSLSLGKKTKTEEGGELHVLIKEAKNLTAMKAGGTSDSFVKGYLLPSKAKSTKRKTPVVKKTLNPHYDHTFVYKDLTPAQLREMYLELTVWDREAMSTNDFLGGVRLSTGAASLNVGNEEVEVDSTGDEVSLWQKMMQYPDSWAEGTLSLRSSMGKNKSK